MFGPGIQDVKQNNKIIQYREEALSCCTHPINMENPIYSAESPKNFAKLNFLFCTQKFSTKIVEKKSYRIESAAPKLQIKLDLSCHSVYNDLFLSQDFLSDILQLDRTSLGPDILKNSVDFNLQELQCPEKAFKTIVEDFKTIAEEIKDWPLWDSARLELIKFILMEAGDAVDQCVPLQHNAINLRFVTTVKHMHVYDEPVSGDCSICLEDFSECEVRRRLPCSHRFHTDCIIKWLLRAQSCPLCRSEITDTDMFTELSKHVELMED